MLYRVVYPAEINSGCINLIDTTPFSWSLIPDHIVKNIGKDYKMNMIEMTETGEFKEKDMILLEPVDELGDCAVSFEWKTDIIGFEDDIF